jgi:AmmeMemoRadiSam system protein B
MALPALRHIDAFPVDHAGQRYICLRDPDGIVEQQMLLTPTAFFVAAHLDGTNGIRDVQQAFARQFNGQRLAAEDVQRVVQELDAQGFLLTEHFEALRQHIEEAFAASTTRPAYLAGKSYPEHPRQLRSFLAQQFIRDGAPGAGLDPQHGDGAPVRCLIAPHIDFHRGGHAYAHAYLQMFKQGRPEVVFIFGVAHVAPPVPFILTQKHFDTPFGRLETDQEVVQRLAGVCSWDPYAYEMVHRTEHSIEFQTVMLSYLFGPEVRIVPVLCGTFGSEFGTIAPAALSEVTTFLEACQEVCKALGKRASVVAGADLAHVGQRFGDPFEIDETIVREVETRDREDLGYVTNGDAEGFYLSVMQDRNKRRICGLNCIYAALKTAMPAGGNGTLLYHDYAPDPAGGIVSFADVVFP